MKTQQATATPKTEVNHSLFYRGKEIFSNKTKSACTGEKLRLLASNCYMAVYFEIKPVA